MNRWLAVAALLLACFAWTASDAEPKKGQSSVECSCGCQANDPGHKSDFKNWSWSGSRADCQAYSGGWCTTSGGAGGKLTDCDVVVTHPLPGRIPGAAPVKQPPS
jgi:hypothetical protein